MIFCLLLLSVNYFGYPPQAPPAPAHAIYLSVVQLTEQATENHRPQLRTRVFYDDFLDVLQNHFSTTKYRQPEQLCDLAAAAIEIYFNEKCLLTINQRPHQLQLIHCERIGEVYELTFFGESSQKWQTVSLDMPFFTEVFPDQSNILHLSYRQQKRFGRTKGSQTLLSFEL